MCPAGTEQKSALITVQDFLLQTIYFLVCTSSTHSLFEMSMINVKPIRALHPCRETTSLFCTLIFCILLIIFQMSLPSKSAAALANGIRAISVRNSSSAPKVCIIVFVIIIILRSLYLVLPEVLASLSVFFSNKIRSSNIWLCMISSERLVWPLIFRILILMPRYCCSDCL